MKHEDLPECVELSTEVQQLFATTRESPRVIRLAIRMRDMFYEEPLREAAGKAVVVCDEETIYVARTEVPHVAY